MARKRHFYLNLTVEQGYTLQKLLTELASKGDPDPEEYSEEEIDHIPEIGQAVDDAISWSDPNRRYEP
jgi:hypothetical protein